MQRFMWQKDMRSVCLVCQRLLVCAVGCWSIHLLVLLTMTVILDMLGLDIVDVHVAGMVPSSFVQSVTGVLGMAAQPGPPIEPRVKSCCPCWCAECPAPRIIGFCQGPRHCFRK